METKEKIGQFFCIRFAGCEVPPALSDWMRVHSIGGVTLFAENCPTVKRTHEIIHRLKSTATLLPLCVAIDHEGGRVHRLPKPVTHFPPLQVLGRLYERMPSSQLAREVGGTMGAELSAIGFDLNFAPVADIHSNPFNPVIGDRAASPHGEVVSVVVRQLIEGMQGAGIAACAKHFPGHGDTNEDSHFVLPRVPHNLRRLRSFELIPFREAIAAKVTAIMTAHVVYNGLEPDTPATFSVKLLRDLLRAELGFQGLVVSDDLTMGAVARYRPLPEACVQAFLAGCDFLLAFAPLPEVEKAIGYFSQAVESGRIPSARVDEAFQRLVAFKERYTREAGDLTPRFDRIGAADSKNLLNKIKQLA